MEVHHHSHKPKNWKEYITEFIMLFAAVTLGFFAENQREHMIENHRAEQYMQSLLEDLKKDTAFFNMLEEYDQNQVYKIDTSTNLLINNVWNDSTIKLLYAVNLKTLGNFPLNINERAASQLKNAGGMRLIQNQDLSNKIAAYWEAAETIKNTGLAVEDYKIRARDKSYSIFDHRFYQNVTTASVKSNVKLMTTDPIVLTEYSNRLNHIRNSLANVRLPQLRNLHKTANELIADLNKEYDFK